MPRQNLTAKSPARLLIGPLVYAILREAVTHAELVRRYGRTAPSKINLPGYEPSEEISRQFERWNRGQVPGEKWLKYLELDFPGISRFRRWGLLEASDAAWRFHIDERKGRFYDRLRGLLFAPEELDACGFGLKPYECFIKHLQESDLFEQGQLLAMVLMSKLSRHSPWAPNRMAREALFDEIVLFHVSLESVLAEKPFCTLPIYSVVEEAHFYAHECRSNPRMMEAIVTTSDHYAR